jgi:hypothetical protein
MLISLPNTGRKYMYLAFFLEHSNTKYMARMVYTVHLTYILKIAMPSVHLSPDRDVSVY